MERGGEREVGKGRRGEERGGERREGEGRGGGRGWNHTKYLAQSTVSVGGGYALDTTTPCSHNDYLT